MTRPPEFDEIVDAEESGPEAERLRRVHDLLVAAGPPPELGPALQAPPPTGDVRPLDLAARRRRRPRTLQTPAGMRYLAAAAAIAAVAFGIGRATARTPGDFAGARTVPLHATAAAPRASAVLEIADSESNGNWPMRLTADALPALHGKDYYAVFLTRGGKVVGLCGYFHSKGGHTEAYLNAPYALKGAGWIVTRQHPGSRTLGQVVLRTTV